ncbi:hypothetical protein C0J52_09949 [Blattella germanica]|nr:hypothetical protein C0J52_09949 [Blattella germanica]
MNTTILNQIFTFDVKYFQENFVVALTSKLIVVETSGTEMWHDRGFTAMQRGARPTGSPVPRLLSPDPLPRKLLASLRRRRKQSVYISNRVHKYRTLYFIQSDSIVKMKLFLFVTIIAVMALSAVLTEVSSLFPQTNINTMKYTPNSVTAIYDFKIKVTSSTNYRYAALDSSFHLRQKFVAKWFPVNEHSWLSSS